MIRKVEMMKKTEIKIMKFKKKVLAKKKMKKIKMRIKI